ncbi:hypothetical protein [Streptomyces formicae]|uniref:Uncharacterized protein n=1 Tax=Streptomyces formicae TaxID=1616117 RepID=A0ABY3WGU0_9ACTN|nr:hypothetical protein [Streptomyces formicae]UNM11788.1 hypothetical protein J4032_09745 [Streptomyces formicae]
MRSSGRSLSLCGLDRLESTIVWADQAGAMTVHTDLESALDAPAPPAD